MFVNNGKTFFVALAIAVSGVLGFAQVDANAQVPTRYMIVLLDRSGSMSSLRTDGSGDTRWEAALQRAEDKINLFSFGGFLNVSVWSFAGSSYTNHTGGFVAPGAAIAVLNSLPGPTSVTPLAMSVCDAVDALIAATPIPALRIVQLNSDGLENSTPSSHECYGTSSTSDTAPYTLGSWQNKVYTKAQGATVHVDLFGSNITFHGGSAAVDEVTKENSKLLTAQTASLVSAKTFFQALTTSTGGEFTNNHDSAPLPVVGDVNGDYCVDDADINAIFADYGLTVPPAKPAHDLNKDGVVDYYDYLQAFNNYGSGSGCTGGPQ